MLLAMWVTSGYAPTRHSPHYSGIAQAQHQKGTLLGILCCCEVCVYLSDAQVNLWILDGPHASAIDVPNAGLQSNA